LREHRRENIVKATGDIRIGISGWRYKRLETFFKLLPRDTKAAARLASRHDHRLDNRAELRPHVKMPLRHALEIRHESFRVQEFIHLLREHDIALVCADAVDWPRLMDITSDFVYVRLHGSEVLYVSGYEDVDIDAWACRVAAWATGNEPSDAECVIRKPAAKRKHATSTCISTMTRRYAPRLMRKP